jgi:soluble lytic murein transglycosylase-like protein
MKARFDEAERTKLLLASYNSGYARVLTALRTYGKNWITSPELHEARRYVNRISSYCDYFSQDVKDINDQLTEFGIGVDGYEKQT